MSIRKKSTTVDIEKQLLEDAVNPKAWDSPVTVPASLSPRPTWYRRNKEKVLCQQPIVHLIGEVAVAFGILELYLELAIWQMVAEDNEAKRKLGEAITAEMTFDRKVHAFYSMFALEFPSEANDAQLKKLVTDLFAAQDKRNQVLHSAWSFSEELGGYTRMKASAKAKNGLRRSVSPVEPSELLAVYRELGDVGERFARFAKERIQDRIVPATKAG